MATSASPRPCAGSSNQGAYGPGRVTSRWQERARRAPSRPSATSSPRRSYSGQKRSTWATISVTPAPSAAAIMPVGLLETHRHRLLAENVLPRARGRDGQLGVERCRHADADGVDRGRQRVLERRRGAPAPALGDRVRPIRVRVDDEQAGRAQPGPRLGVDPAREAGTDDGDVHAEHRAGRGPAPTDVLRTPGTPPAPCPHRRRRSASTCPRSSGSRAGCGRGPRPRS